MTQHIVVATPCYGGQVSSQYTNAMLNLQRECIRQGIELSCALLGGDALITRARNMLVQRFLDTPGATHLLFIDADIGFQPEQVFALLGADKDVCGAVYPLKRLDWPTIQAMIDLGIPRPETASLNYVVDFLEPDEQRVEGDFVTVRSLGTGFLLIRREVLTRMAAQYPELAYGGVHGRSDEAVLENASAYALFDCMIDPDSRVYLSEDYAFCRRWRDMGGEIWAHSKSRLAHVGAQVFNGDPTFLMGSRLRPHRQPSIKRNRETRPAKANRSDD